MTDLFACIAAVAAAYVLLAVIAVCIDVAKKIGGE